MENPTENSNGQTKELSTVYQDSISNLKLREGDMYCVCCDQVIKKTNLERHDNSKKHKKAVLTFVRRMQEAIAEGKRQREVRTANRLARKLSRSKNKTN